MKLRVLRWLDQVETELMAQGLNPGPAQSVASALGWFANWNTGGDCHPGQKRIARRAGVSVSTVKRALKVLERMGALRRFKRYKNKTPGRQTNAYQLNLDYKASSGAGPSDGLTVEEHKQKLRDMAGLKKPKGPGER